MLVAAAGGVVALYPVSGNLQLVAANGSSQSLPINPSVIALDADSNAVQGVEPDGGIRLPNQWAIRPAGRQIELGDFPVEMALHPQGRWLAVLHAGYGKHEIMILDLQARRQLPHPREESRETV